MSDIVIIFIFCIIFVFLSAFLSYNPYTSTIIFGKKGTGKTTYMAKLALQYYKKGWKVYSTTPIAYAQVFDPSQLLEYTFPHNSVILVDEVGLIWNNRNFKNFDDRLTVFFKYLRQYKLKIFMFSQAFDVDKKIRDTMDNIYITKRIGDYSILRGVAKVQGISTDMDGNGQLVDTYSYDFFNNHITYLPRYYGLFNSYNPPHRPQIPHRLYYDVPDYYKWSSFFKMKFLNIIKNIKHWCILQYYDIIFIDIPFEELYMGVLIPFEKKKGRIKKWLNKLLLS